MAPAPGDPPYPGSLVGVQTYTAAGTFLRAPSRPPETKADVKVLGLPLDLATSNRPGARFGPAAIRAATAQLAELKAYPAGIDPLETLDLIDCGDVFLDFGRPAGIPDAIREAATAAAADGAFLIGLGGDHFVTYPLLAAQARRAGGPIALVQFDAHPDTWPESPGEGIELNHGTMLTRAIRDGVVDPAASIQVGIRTWVDDTLGVAQIDAETALALDPAALLARIAERVGDRPYYLTVDIDCLDPAYAPGTGTPVIGGLTTVWVQSALRRLTAWRLPVAMDVVEVAPAYDRSDITALAAATIAYETLVAVALKRRETTR